MSPSEINFDSFTGGSTSALSGSDTAEKLADSKDKGLRPLLSYFETLISDYVVSDFSDKYVFRWTGLDDEDQDERNERAKLILTLNEMRAQEGYDAIKDPIGDAPLNPSLIGPWLQMQQQDQQGGDFNGEEQGGDTPEEGNDFGQGGDESGGDFGKSDDDAEGDDQGNPDDDDPHAMQADFGGKPDDGDGPDFGKMAKARQHGICVGDEVFCNHPKQGALAGRVKAYGKDGFTVHDGKAPVTVPWDGYLGHKKRAKRAYTMIDDGDDGMLVEDAETGKRSFIAGAVPGEENDDDLMAGLDENETPITKAIRMGTWA